MFDNIGRKIKTLAKILCWVGIAFSVIAGIAIMSSGNGSLTINGTPAAVSPAVIGIIYMIIGCLVSWIGSFFAYGFGQLIENSEEIKKNLSK